jgi:hypothetical protein
MMVLKMLMQNWHQRMGSRIKNQTLPSKIKRIQKLTLDKFMKKERQTEKQKKSSDKYKQ